MPRLPAPPPPRTQLSTLGLAAATFFIVSGGPYGLEEIVLGHGYGGALALLALLPLVWSLPCALLVGELAAALPATGGYYAWVKRGLGPFWGLQEGWLSLAYSVVDIAIYPTLLVTYLTQLFPALGGEAYGRPGWWVGIGVIAACTAWNMAGIRSIGRGSTALAVALLAPFAVMVVLALATLPHGGAAAAASAFHAHGASDSGALVGGLMLAMWNLMGFDNASTFAAEVRDPGKSYPRAILLGAIAITLSYVVTVLAASTTGLPPASWSSGSWVEVGARLGGPTLAAAVMAGGVISAFGMYNALLLAWSRLPVALAEDRWLPAALARRSARTHAPIWSVLLGGVLSALCVGVGLRRLVEIDVLLYGAALVLEFAALVALRMREPELARPFRIPGGLPVVVAVALLPTALLAVAAWKGRDEPAALGMTAVGLSLAVAAVGPVWWAARRFLRWRAGAAAATERG
jgi:amino acid transporter